MDHRLLSSPFFNHALTHLVSLTSLHVSPFPDTSARDPRPCCCAKRDTCTFGQGPGDRKCKKYRTFDYSRSRGNFTVKCLCPREGGPVHGRCSATSFRSPFAVGIFTRRPQIVSCPSIWPLCDPLSRPKWLIHTVTVEVLDICSPKPLENMALNIFPPT